MGSPPQLELTLLNRESDVAHAQDALERFAADHGIRARPLHEAQLALEEHLSNIIKYAYTDDGEHRIKVRFLLETGCLKIEVVDDGQPFNPLDHPPPDLDLPVDKRPVGGLGIHMMRQSVNELVYRREDGKNRLVFIKNVSNSV